jgi:Protein of unknown function (DUF2924)
MTVPALKRTFCEVFGAEARIGHKEYLLRRLAWNLQARADRGLTENVRRRIEDIADVCDVHGAPPIAAACEVRSPASFLATISSPTERDPLLLPVSNRVPPAAGIPVPSSVPLKMLSARVRDPRLPPVGSLLRRHYQGREIIVRVLDEGFEYDSQCYRSLSAIARHITGTHWNGLLFFNLTERRYA